MALFSVPAQDASEMGASCGEVDVVCLCEAGPCTLYSEAHTPTPDTLLCEHCGKNRVIITRYSEGYGTEEECVLSDPQGESDADADIEDTDCRLQEPGSLQRISSRRRKRPRVARQDTTESEDDGGRSHRSHRWNLRLSPDRAHSRTILEEAYHRSDLWSSAGKTSRGKRVRRSCLEAPND
ncbi:uncharacterized protein si:ch211-63p21.1 isoform X2 [Plectropomus leopardus]|uniref:uncharacterized protein si:ch211-63p21.1 isoform X2 n=1 Tax=Plectropomus leopardus TaxID=160734 RepID=UPI001C4A9C79|nr:uncharacterized protein si:ch211-63p21.1 isoform X2 [Plectropomus leopardus]